MTMKKAQKFILYKMTQIYFIQDDIALGLLKILENNSKPFYSTKKKRKISLYISIRSIDPELC